MGRLIKTENAGKDRTRLIKSVVVAIRELARQTEMGENAHDLIAYLALSIIAISETIDESVAAWEKRGYWVKADRFRMDWSWTARLGEEIRQAALHEDWDEIIKLVLQVSQKLNKVNVPEKNRIGAPWIGAWKVLINSSRSKV